MNKPCGLSFRMKRQVSRIVYLLDQYHPNAPPIADWLNSQYYKLRGKEDKQKLTRTVKIKRPIWGGWPVLSFKPWIFLVYIPVDIIENLVELLLSKDIDADHLLNLPRLVYATRRTSRYVDKEINRGYGVCHVKPGGCDHKITSDEAGYRGSVMNMIVLVFDIILSSATLMSRSH